VNSFKNNHYIDGSIRGKVKRKASNSNQSEDTVMEIPEYANYNPYKKFKVGRQIYDTVEILDKLQRSISINIKDGAMLLPPCI